MKTIKTILFAKTFLGLILIAGCNDNNRVANSPPSDTAPLITEITPERDVTTIAGGITSAHRDGPVNQALFHTPKGVAVDAENKIYVADYGNNSVRKITPEGEVSTLLLGLSNEGFTDGAAEEGHPSGMPLGRINGPTDLEVDEDGTIYFSDVHITPSVASTLNEN